MVDVNGFVADIIVAADNDVRSLFAQLINPYKEILEKLHLEVLTDIARRTTRNIGVHDGDVAEVRTQHAALAVVLGIAHTYHHFVRFALGEDTHAGVAFFLRRVDITAVAEFLHRQHINLLGLRFALLNTEHIRVLGG